MAEMNVHQILKDVGNKVVHPVYFLMGEETYYIDVIADNLEESILTDTEKEFNLTIFYGKDTEIPEIISTARRYPMMASHNIVIVREAQHLKDIDALMTYLQKPLESTILVVCYKYKTLDKRTRFYKFLNHSGVVYNGKKLYDSQVPDWISGYVKQNGYRISPAATKLLSDHLGSDLGKIVNEVKKLFINLNKGSEITPLVIEENIGISKDFNMFEFQNALGAKNKQKAYQIAKYFADNPRSNPFVMTSGILYQFFSKVLLYHSLKDKSQKNAATELGVHSFFIKDYMQAAKNYSPNRIIEIFSQLRSYDLKSKGLGNETTDQGELVKELTYKILNHAKTKHP